MSTKPDALAIIPARGGSARIPRKNIREFLGKPMIAYPIQTALASGLFARVVVSTDDDEIAEVAEGFGAEVPFRRPQHLSHDATTTDAVLQHAVMECERAYGSFARACCIYPTTPLLTSDDLAHGLELLLEAGATSVFPLVEYEFPIEQAFVLEGFHPRPCWPEKILVRSQDLEPRYHDAGMFYWFDVAKFAVTKQLFSEDSAAFVLPSTRCQDINTEADWRAAELKYRLFTGRDGS